MAKEKSNKPASGAISTAPAAVKQGDKIAVGDAVNLTYMSQENTTFAAFGDFVRCDTNLPNEDGEIEDRHYNRVYFHKSFPFDRATEYISVLDDENREIGLIRDIEIFEGATKRLIISELDKKYYAPKVTAIHSIKEKYGYSTWDVDTDAGRLRISVRDTYRSLIRAEGDRIFILDADQNRYEISDYKTLDPKSFKKLDMYL